MKTTVKKTNDLTNVATIQRNFFPTIEGVTSGGKKCVALVTDLRLSTDDFKKLMADISLAGGYGFMKFHAEIKKRYITATGIDGTTLASLASQFVWSPAIVETAKKDIAKQSGKGPKSKKDQTENKATALTDIAAADPKVKALLDQLSALLK